MRCRTAWVRKLVLMVILSTAAPHRHVGALRPAQAYHVFEFRE
jgi:hypothetical protein